jgi:probable F420-dependent oxidoreductase
VVEVARAADELGLDEIALPDHLAVGPRTDRYPYGRFPLPLDEPWLEPMTALAAMAGATRRIRLATAVLIAPLRSPLLLAKTAATLDVLSEGRLELGVGLGWQEEEFAAAGVPFGGRWARLLDALRACRALWSEAPASYHSPTLSFDSLWCLPRPQQPGGVPIWFGVAASERAAAAIAELGAGWMPIASEPAALAAGVARLRAAFAARGRDPASLGVRASAAGVADTARGLDVARTRDALAELGAAGATLASFPLARFARSAAEIPRLLERLARLRG